MANYRKSFNLRNGVQVDDDNFIVNANGLVGIGTSVPTEFLDVRGNAKVVGLVTANTLYAGIATVGFLTSRQGLSVSGVVTATSFSGSASGLTGIYAIAVDGWYVTSGSISTTSNVGIGTTIPQGNLQIGTGITFNSNGNATYSGIVTAISFSGSGLNITSIDASNISSGTLSNSRLPSNINVSGVITATSGFVGNLNGNVTGILTGNVTGTASTAQSLTGTPNIIVGVVTASSVGSGFATAGITTAFSTLHVGTGGTAFSALNSGRIGVGTALPTSDVQVRKSNGTLIEVVSDTSQARISIGQSVGVGRSTAVLRFGSTNKTFDILNNDTGNINMYLHAGPAGVGTGRFAWVYGQSNAELASLTYTGNFGIGITNPTSNLHVVGTSTVTGNANFGSNVTVAGNLTATSFTLPSIISNTNIYNTSGISTFYNIKATNNVVTGVGSVGIATDSPIVGLDARSSDGLFSRIGINTVTFGTELLNVSGSARFGSIGIGTSAATTGIGLVITNEIQQYNSTTTLTNSILYVTGTSGVGVGTTSVRAALDFADAGKINPGLLPGEGTGSRAYMLPPRLTTAQRVGLATAEGAFIFNTDTKKFQGYTGVGWTDFH